VTFQRLVLTFTREGIEIRALYRTKHGPNRGTKARHWEITELTRTDLTKALDALKSDTGVEVVWTREFTTREDILLATASPDSRQLGRA
jgi:hypothetical protein